VAAGAVLAGCTPVDHIAARIVGHSPEFVYCPAASLPINNRVTAIYVWAGPDKGTAKQQQLVWEVHGKTDPLKAGTAVVVGDAPPGWKTVTSHPVPTNRGTKYGISFEYSQYGLEGVFLSNQMSSRTWLRWDNSSSTNACP
jgi:hypothetical protein